MKSEREANHKRRSFRKHPSVAGGEVVGEWGGGRALRWSEHWVLFATDESLNLPRKLVRHYMLINQI